MHTCLHAALLSETAALQGGVSSNGCPTAPGIAYISVRLVLFARGYFKRALDSSGRAVFVNQHRNLALPEI